MSWSSCQDVLKLSNATYKISFVLHSIETKLQTMLYLGNVCSHLLPGLNNLPWNKNAWNIQFLYNQIMHIITETIIYLLTTSTCIGHSSRSQLIIKHCFTISFHCKSYLRRGLVCSTDGGTSRAWSSLSSSTTMRTNQTSTTWSF